MQEIKKEEKRRAMVEYEKPLKERANALEDMYKQRDKDAFNNMIKAKREKYIQGKLKEEARRRLVAENRRQFALKKKRNVMAKKLKKLAIDEERAVVEMLKRQELEAQQEDEKSGKSYQQEDHDVEMMLKIQERGIPDISDGPPRLGIFGKPLNEKSYARTGHVPGVDDHTLSMSLAGTGPTDAAFEERKTAYYDLEQKEGKLTQEYETLKRAQLEAEEERLTLEERVTKVAEDIAQHRLEQKEFEDELAGVGQRHVGRRLAYRFERVIVDERKERIMKLLREKKDLEIRCKNLADERDEAAMKELRIAPRLAVIREKKIKAEAGLEKEQEFVPSLPMVIGRSIREVPSLRHQLAASKREIRDVLLGSKLEILKEESKLADKRLADLRRLNHEEWKAKHRRQEQRAVVELGEARLGNILGRLRHTMGEMAHGDIQGAVKKFWKNDKLRKVNIVHEGWVNWWGSRDKAQTAGVDQWNVENVILGKATFGVIQGRIEFPKVGLWQIDFLVTKADELAPAAGDPNDFITVRMGGSAMSLDLVGKFNNVRAPGQAGVRYSVSRQYQGNKLTYRFEMASSTESIDDHMLVTRGRYRQIEPEPLELIDPKTNRVLSSYVKKLRIERKQGKSRGAVLLEELIKLENAGDEVTTWDSLIVNGHFQRFKKEHLAAYLRDELKRQMGYDRKIADREAQARQEADMREKMRSDKVNDKNHKMADQQFKKREKERADRITELRKMEQGEDIDQQQIDEIYSDSEDEIEAKEREKKREVKKWPRAGHKAPNAANRTINEEPDRQTTGAPGKDDGTSFKQPNQSSMGSFDDQPNMFAANEDKPRRPGEESEEELEQKRNRFSLEDGKESEVDDYEDDEMSNEMKNNLRPQTADLVQALKNMRRARERKKRLKVSEIQKKYKESRLAKKIKQSKRAFIMRKRRGIQVDLEMARELVGSRLELYFQEEQRWRLGSVVEMRVQWTQGGTNLQVLHSVCYYGAEGSPVQWENLTERRFVILKSDMASVDARRAVMEEKRRIRFEVEKNARSEAAEREMKILQDAENQRMADAEELRKQMREDMKKTITDAKASAYHMAETPIMQAEFEAQHEQIMEEFKQGIGTEDGFAEFIEPEAAVIVAKEKYIKKTIAVARLNCRRKWEEVWAGKKEEARLNREAEAAAAELRREEDERIAEESRMEYLQQVALERDLMRNKLKIPNFQKALPPVSRCEHVNIKYWATLYGKGIRCKDCNMELTKSHEDLSQLCTISAELEDAIQRHRNEEHGAFRFKDAAQLNRIYAERRRTEKEERLVLESEPGFYDLRFEKDVEEMYGRHRYSIQEAANALAMQLSRVEAAKLAGTEDMKASEQVALAMNTEIVSEGVDNLEQIVGSQAETFMGGMLQVPLRVRDFIGKRRARHRDVLGYYARLDIFMFRVNELHAARALMKTHKAQFTRRLGQCHMELVMFEDRMAEVEEEHSRCENILQRRHKAQNKHNVAVEGLEEATKQLYIASEQRAQTESGAVLREQEHKEVELQVREMLSWREWAVEQMKQAKKEVEDSTLKFESAQELLLKVSELPERLHYCRRGQVLFVRKWGRVRVLFYRPGEGEEEIGKATAKDKRNAADAEELAKIKLAEMEKEAEERRKAEANNPDVLFKWLCKFCGRTNKRIDVRCRGCDTKKPLKVVRAETAFLEKRKEEQENEKMIAEEAWQRDMMEKIRVAALVKAGWKCTICDCENPAEAEKCKDCGRMGKPKAFVDAQAEEKKAREREERAKRLADPMPPTLVVMPGGGWPVGTKIYLPVDNVVKHYQAVRNAENLAMAAEDEAMKKFYDHERIQEIRERKEMKIEDDNTAYMVRWERWEKEITAEVSDAKKVAAAAAPAKLNTQLKQSEIKDKAKAHVDEVEVQKLKEANSWDGKGKKPVALNRIAKFRLKRNTVKRLKKEFLEEEEKKAEDEVREKWRKKEETLVQDEQSWLIFLDDVVNQYAEEVAREIFNGSIQARERAETDSGVVFPSKKNNRGQDIPMHHAVYMRLLRVQNGRMMEIRQALAKWGKSLKLVLQDEEPEETEEQKERRLKLEAQRAREKAEREAMQRIEKECKAFYKEEMKLCLIERRAMANAEREMKKFLQDEEFYSRKSKYDVGGSEPKQKPSRKALRRAEMKKKTAERQRIKREVAQMMLEDELGKAMQLEDMRLRQEAQMKSELAFDDVSSSSDEGEDDGDEDDEEDEDSVDYDSQESSSDEDELPPPSMQHFADEVSETKAWRKQDKEALLRTKRKMRRKKRLGKPPSASDRAKLESRLKFAKASADLAIAVQRAVMDCCKAELSLMQSSNEFFMALGRLAKAKENMQRINFHSRKRNQEEQRLRVIARKEREIADDALNYENEQQALVNHLKPEVRRLLILRRKVEELTKFMDTTVLHGRSQRFETDTLYKELHYQYFYILAQTIATRSELCVIERRLIMLQEAIRANAVIYHKKRVQMKALRRQHDRDERLRLRKSVLGKEMFYKYQMKALEFAFSAWNMWLRSYVGKRKAFQLRYALVKHEFDLRRVTNEERQEARRKMHGTAGYNEFGGEFSKDNEPAWARHRRKERELAGLYEPEDSIVRPNVPRSLLKTHQNRKAKCLHCCKLYSEVQNHSEACEFHPGQFSVMCPRSCPFRGKKADTVKCIAHYKRRWSCCDSVQESEFGIGGCSKRWHVARPDDKGYKALLEYETARDDKITGELRIAMKDHDTALRKNRKLGMDRMNDAIKFLEKERNIVEKYKNLQWQ